MKKISYPSSRLITQRWQHLCVLFLSLLLHPLANAGIYSKTVILEPTPDLPYRLQEEIIKAKPNTLIQLPEGRFQFEDEVVLDVSHVTLRGRGMDKTILSFKDQPSGAQGVLVLADAFTVEDLAIEDTAGDGLRIEGANGVVIRRTRVEWTNGPDETNGAYGLYPVLSQNILVEDSIVRGASDAGIYVGQSHNVIIRRNVAEYNVAGIEVENTTNADVYENVARHNTGGLLVFDLPGLSKAGAYSRVYDNIIEDNNTSNFAPEGNIVGSVPSGTGLMIMATDHVDVYNNVIRGNKTVGVLVISYLAIALINDLPIPEDYDPFPEYINIHNNTIIRPGGLYFDGSDVNNLLNILHYTSFKPVSEIIFDGILNPEFESDDMSSLGRQICIYDNKRKNSRPKFSNVHVDNTDTFLYKAFGIPGGPVDNDRTAFNCQNEPFEGVTLPPFPDITPPGDEDYTEEEIKALCESGDSGVNFNAAVVNCPNLSHYRLFEQPNNPTSLVTRGFHYELTTPLFSDYASKYRQIFLPPGQSANYEEAGILNFPEGTIISKTFTIKADLNAPNSQETVLETRLLIRRKNQWVGLPYIWNEDKSDATLALGGGKKTISFIDYNGDRQTTQYGIPNANQCRSCHTDGSPIGPKARLLNRPALSQSMNQLTLMKNQGLLNGLPALETVPRTPDWSNPNDGTLEDRAKAYLDVNCAHCHGPGGRAFSTGLLLNESLPVDSKYGLCKPPVAAGRGSGGFSFDIEPGNPEESILFFRMESVDPAIRMPELGRTLMHKEGNELIHQWISSLSGTCETTSALQAVEENRSKLSKAMKAYQAQ